MEFEAWWLLALPLFFVLGWAAARRDRRQASAGFDDVTRKYLSGLTSLLNEQYDQAIAAFVDVVSVEPEAVELHFALGALFRRRGESDRAIRVHQNLVDRGDLTEAQRHHALYELGLDFLKAGLIDRAEAAFHRLDGTVYAQSAARHRLEIAQKSRDWDRAIELARQQDDPETARAVVAHAHCEQAEQALRSQQMEAAADAARQAWAAAPAHPRPSMLLGRIALQAGARSDALRAFEGLAERNPEHVSLIVDHWLAAAGVAGAKADGGAAAASSANAAPVETGTESAAARAVVHHIRAVAESTGSPDIMRSLAPAMARVLGQEETAAWLRGLLGGHPSLIGLLALLELSPTLKAHPDGEALRKALQWDADRLSRYVCGQCGFRAQSHYWHCPGCAHWDSYVPRRIENLDVLV